MEKAHKVFEFRCEIFYLFFSIIVNIFMQYVMTGRLSELTKKTVTGKQMYPAHII